jgi:hypothetical protein
MKLALVLLVLAASACAPAPTLDTGFVVSDRCAMVLNQCAADEPGVAACVRIRGGIGCVTAGREAGWELK